MLRVLDTQQTMGLHAILRFSTHRWILSSHSQQRRNCTVILCWRKVHGQKTNRMWIGHALYGQRWFVRNMLYANCAQVVANWNMLFSPNAGIQSEFLWFLMFYASKSSLIPMIFQSFIFRYTYRCGRVSNWGDRLPIVLAENDDIESETQ